ncbi:LytTR family transcriptional regulator DNA-binding domain-containing protein [Paenibacillus solisilvae]|uniref:LytTR family transcriptional regulator DNA-binding domain-containing protein n=1 Tax=Paenibacillus solisilvae TaxID=2486751 RepID=A0ABW0W7G6_9BACL
MMNVASENSRNLYESFEVEKDIYYFKVGTLGLVSFHGRNYNIKKVISADELNKYITSGQFVRVSGSCYVNTGKIVSLTGGMILFDQKGSDTKQVPVSKWRQHHIKNLLSARKPIAM